MDVRIGIIHSPRELSFETDADPKELTATLETALDEEETKPLTLTDNKGKTYVVPVSSIAYIEFGGQEQRKIGFVN